MDDVRCTMENLLDARELGADLCNQCEVLSVQPIKNNSFELEVNSPKSIQNIKINCSKIAVTAGAWSDLVIQKLFKSTQKYLMPSSGIHLFIDGLDCSNPLILPIPDSERFFFVIPWRRGHLVGTTEKPVKYSNGGESEATKEEVEELEGNLRHYFPKSNWSISAVTSAVRPLAAVEPSLIISNYQKNGKKSSIKVSRKHDFVEMRAGVVSGIGGKFTTHRIFAEELFEKLFPRLKYKGLEKRIFPGAKNWTSHEDTQKELRLRGVPREFLYRWASSYGSIALDFTESCRDEESRPANLEAWLGLELEYSKSKEWARTADDFIRRRSNLYFSKEIEFYKSEIESFFSN
jgi:glycerol-3-phosphate dehydrogenase